MRQAISLSYPARCRRKGRNALKNQWTKILLFAGLLAMAVLPARAQDAAATLAVATPVAAVPAPALAPWGVPEGRAFFPHDWLRGYVDYEVAPSHNEPDLGRCSPSGTVIVAAGGVNSNCNAYARYLLGGYLEVQPFGKTFARHIFVFWTPMFSFGNNVPQFKYTASMAGIAYERALGVGLELPKNFEIRVTQHQVDWLGKYKGNVGLADLGTAGPYGLYATVGARWYFGGYGHVRQDR
jgi:hypothetical protein